MGKIINFNLKKNNIDRMGMYNISHDNIFKDVIKDIDICKTNNYTDLVNNKFIKAEEHLNTIINDKVFKDRVISILKLIKNYTDKEYLNIDNNNVIGYLNEKNYLFISMKDKNIEYAIENEENCNYGKLRYYGDKYVINYSGVNNSYLYDLNNKNKRKTIIRNNDTSIYDSLGFVMARKNRIITNNYDVFYRNGEEYSIPDKLNNCTTCRMTRVGSNVLKNIKINYLNKDLKSTMDRDVINKDNFYIGFNYNINGKEIPDDIYYQEIDYGDYLNIKRGR